MTGVKLIKLHILWLSLLIFYPFFFFFWKRIIISLTWTFPKPIFLINLKIIFLKGIREEKKCHCKVFYFQVQEQVKMPAAKVQTLQTMNLFSNLFLKAFLQRFSPKFPYS